MSSAQESNIAPPPIIAPATGRRTLWPWILLSLVIVGLVVIYFFDPTRHGFYPACHFYKLTHLHCPGCGTLRGLHLLTHGQIGAAFSSNPLLIGGLPLIASVALWRWKTSPDPERTQWIKPTESWLVLAVVIVFGVLRNLPYAAVAWMSP